MWFANIFSCFVVVFYLLDRVLYRAKLNFFIDHAFEVKSKNSLLNSGYVWKIFSYGIFLKGLYFYVLCLNLCPICCYLLYKVRFISRFLITAVSFVLKVYPSSIKLLFHLCQKSLSIFIWVYFWVLCSVPLICFLSLTYITWSWLP